MDWRYEYIDLEKIRELMEKTDGWEESRQREFYGYLLEKKDEFFRSEFGDLFLEMYKEKLGASDLELIRQRKAKQPEPKTQPDRPWFLRVLPTLLLAAAVSAGSIWAYRKAEGQSTRKHLESLQAAVHQSGEEKAGRGDGTGLPEQAAGDDGRQGGQNGGAQRQTEAAAGQNAQTDQNSGVQETPPVLEQYEELSRLYPELFGWLAIPDTGINYPVMKPEAEKDYYLHHNFEGASDDEGALFVDYLCCGYPRDDNIVIYGHNMKNGHMFGELKNYGSESYFQANREIIFDTLYETGRYEAVAVLQTHIKDEAEDGFRYYQFFNYETEEEFQECLNFIQENQIYDMENKLWYGDQLLMLSTCDYAQDHGRFVVVARKMQ